MEEADGVEGDDGDAGVAVVDGDGGGDEGVMDGEGGLAGREAGDPHGSARVGHVRRDVHGPEPDAEGTWLPEGGGGVDGDLDAVAGEAVARRPEEASKDQRGEQQQGQQREPRQPPCQRALSLGGFHGHEVFGGGAKRAIPKGSMTGGRDAGNGPVPHGGSMELRPGTAARPALGQP